VSLKRRLSSARSFHEPQKQSRLGLVLSVEPIRAELLLPASSPSQLVEIIFFLALVTGVTPHATVEHWIEFLKRAAQIAPSEPSPSPPLGRTSRRKVKRRSGGGMEKIEERGREMLQVEAAAEEPMRLYIA
jgi:hypothetical protein